MIPFWVRQGQKVICIAFIEAIPQPIIGHEYTIDEVKLFSYRGKNNLAGITLKELPVFGDEELDGPTSVWKYYDWDSFRPVEAANFEKKIEEHA